MLATLSEDTGGFVWSVRADDFSVAHLLLAPFGYRRRYRWVQSSAIAAGPAQGFWVRVEDLSLLRQGGLVRILPTRRRRSADPPWRYVPKDVT